MIIDWMTLQQAFVSISFLILFSYMRFLPFSDFLSRGKANVKDLGVIHEKRCSGMEKFFSKNKKAGGGKNGCRLSRSYLFVV
jgi:hypothetical protein